MKPSPILVSLDHNEAARPRAAKVEKAVLEDERFEMRDPADLQFDLRFSSGGCCPEKCAFQEINSCGQWGKSDTILNCSHFLPETVFHVELKDFSEDSNSDYLNSILSGHLWGQVLAARESGQPLAIVVLGDDNDVGAAIRKAASRNHTMDVEKLLEYFGMVEGFEANCIALNIQVWRLKTDPYKRMLLRVRKILHGGDLTGFAPRPAEGERQAVGLSILAGKGIGTVKAAAIIEKFQLILEPWTDDCYLTDCDGIGEKLARQLGDSKILAVDCRHVLRPPKPKKSKAKAEAA